MLEPPTTVNVWRSEFATTGMGVSARSPTREGKPQC